jgi:hypothetical protein
MDCSRDKKVKEEPTGGTKTLDPNLPLNDRNVYLGIKQLLGTNPNHDAGRSNPRRVTGDFKSMRSSHPVDTNTAAGDMDATTKTGTTDVIAILDDDEEEVTDGDAADKTGGCKVEEEKKPLPTKQKAKLQGRNGKGAIFVLSDEEEVTDTDYADDDGDYETDEEKKSSPSKQKAKLPGRNRGAARAINRAAGSRQPPPPGAAAAAAGNTPGAAITPTIRLGSKNHPASREYKEFMDSLAITLNGTPWSDNHYQRLRRRFSGHDFVFMDFGQLKQAKKQDIYPRAEQTYKMILKKLKHQGKVTVNKKRADGEDNNPTAATRRRTAPAEAELPAAATTAVVPIGHFLDIERLTETYLSELKVIKARVSQSDDPEVYDEGKKILNLIKHVEEGMTKHGA